MTGHLFDAQGFDSEGLMVVARIKWDLVEEGKD
jgi:hypothetical protein